MPIIVLTLLIPLLGLGLLFCDSQRQTALPFQSRSFWAMALRFLGLLAVPVGLGTGFFAIMSLDLEDAPGGLISTLPLFCALGLATLLTGIQTFRVPRSWPSENEDWDAGDVVDRDSHLSLWTEPRSSRLRSGAWLMALYPLLFVLPILGVFGVFLLVVGAIVLSTFIHNRRAFQSQLLWLLAISARNKLPLSEELRSLSEDKGVRLKKKLKQAAKDLEHGDTLSMAVEQHGLLPTATIAAIRVSEGGGRLDETLRRLATHSTDRLKVYNLSQIGEILLQLFVLLMIGSGVVGFVMYFIIPKFKEIFIGFDVELPEATAMLIDLSDHVVTVSSVMLFWIGIGIFLLVWHTLRHVVGWSSLPYPILMHWFPKRDAPEVLRALGGIAREGVSIPQKMLLLTDRPGRPDLGARYRRISESMMAGETLSNALYAQGLLTPLQRESVAAGERGGHLEFVLFSLAEALEQREFRRGAYWAELLKPIAIVSCGIVTAFVVIALFLPLVKLLNELS